jgi:hypothetical protein
VENLEVLDASGGAPPSLLPLPFTTRSCKDFVSSPPFLQGYLKIAEFGMRISDLCRGSLHLKSEICDLKPFNPPVRNRAVVVKKKKSLGRTTATWGAYIKMDVGRKVLGGG